MLNIIVGKIRVTAVLERPIIESKYYIVTYNARKDRYELAVKRDDRSPVEIAHGTLEDMETIYNQYNAVAAVKDQKYEIVRELGELGFYTEYIGDGHFIGNNDEIDVEVFEYADATQHYVKLRVAPRGCHWQLQEVASIAEILEYSAATKQLELNI